MGQVNKYRAALYCRLSKDDENKEENKSESASIVTQKKMLEAYAQEKEFVVYDVYIDDGYSGTNFNRPDFERMITDIERGEVNLVITKDLSRLGRDYIATGQYTEIYFPEKNVRYIAINDGYDSIYANNNDITPFRNVINEMYARDTSKKIKSAFETKMRQGDFISAFAPYGYKKSGDNKNKLVIDEDAAEIVRMIFEMARNGQRPSAIRDYLNENHIPTPAEHRCSRFPRLKIENYSKRRAWNTFTVNKLLNNQVYIGHVVQGKTSKISFKSDKTVNRHRKDWIVVKNTHVPIVDEETYELVRKHVAGRTLKSKGKFENIFSGIAKCADCGRNMSSAGSRKNGSAYNLVCGGYKIYGKRECSNHFIDYDQLYYHVLADIKKQITLTVDDIEDILKSAKNAVEKQTGYDNKKVIKAIGDLSSRNKEIDLIIEKLYEDNVSGKISDERFSKLLEKFETEQEQNSERKASFNRNQENDKAYLGQLKKNCELVNKYAEINELTADMLFELTDHIEVGQGYYDEKKNKYQDIKIFYRFAVNG